MGLIEKCKTLGRQFAARFQQADHTAEVAELIAAEEGRRAYTDTVLAASIADLDGWSVQVGEDGKVAGIAGKSGGRALIDADFSDLETRYVASGAVSLTQDGSVVCNGTVYGWDGSAALLVEEPAPPPRSTTASRRAQQRLADHQRKVAPSTPLNRQQRRALAALKR